MTSEQSRFPVAPSNFRFSRYPNHEDGVWISDLMPHVVRLVGQLRPRQREREPAGVRRADIAGFGNMQALSARFWGSGFLPSGHQGCKLRSAGEPVLYLNDPGGVTRADRRRMLDLIGTLNEQEMARSLDPEVGARISQTPIDVHDLHATLLHLLGLDHQRLTYRHQGRDFRLTDVFGNVRPELLA